MIRRRSIREAALALLVALAVLVAPRILPAPDFLQALETASQDFRYRIRGVEAPRPDIAVILVDDASLAELGRWPLDRRLYARAIDRLDAADARLILFDMLFSEPDPAGLAPERDLARRAAAAIQGPDHTDLRAALLAAASNDPDADFATAIRRSGRVLLAAALSTDPGPEADLSDAAFQRFDPSSLAPEATMTPRSALVPIGPLAAAAAGIGLVNTAADPDGVPRLLYLAIPYDGDYLPTMAVRAASILLGIPWDQAGLAPGEAVHLGSITVPTDRAMRFRYDHYGPRGTFPIYRFADLVKDRIPADKLRGRTVILGASFVGNPDSSPSQFDPVPVPGSERIATALANILDERFLREPPPLGLLGFLLALLVLAGLSGACTALLPTRTVALAGILPMAAWFAGAQLAFGRGWLIPLVIPEAALAAAVAASLLLRYVVTERDGRRIKATFKRYLSPQMVDILAAHPERVRLGGETRALTLMFCDIRGFTTISEAYQADPQGLTRLINRFLTPMSEIILAHGGTIDKYIGDCIMAFWNAPLDDSDHAARACACALAMRAALETLNATLAAEAAHEGHTFHPIRIGIGLNSGDCVVGNMGSEQRRDYSVLGDAVNLASRLEGQSKAYGVDIVIGATTRVGAPGFAALELDLIAVKGKQEAVRIFALLGGVDLGDSADFQALQARHEALLVAYRAADGAADAALDACRTLAPELGALYDVYAERLLRHRQNPPGPEWGGVYVAETK
jgi:adenylate cyclase